MNKYLILIGGLLLAGCSHSGGQDNSTPPPATLDAYCQQDGNILSIQAPGGSSTRCEQPPRPPHLEP